MDAASCSIPSCQETGPVQTVKVRGINTLKQRSMERGDDFHVNLQAILDSSGKDAELQCHKKCYCSYTSRHNVEIYIAKKRKQNFSTSELEPNTFRVRRSQLPSFQFLKHCLICGKDCVPKDPKHPERWVRVVKCQTKDRPGQLPFKDVLLDVCEQRNDEWGRQVEIRIKGALTDLPAADAQYHKKCYKDFVTIPKYTDLSSHCEVTDDDALKMVIDDMYDKQFSCTWTSTELHDIYCRFGGILSSKQMLTKLIDCLGDDIVLVRMEGCASVIGFKHLLGKILKIVKAETADEDCVNTIIRQVKREAQALKHRNADYDLSEFTHKATLEQTSDTLLRVISELVSNGQVTQKSLSLTQAVQSHITGTRNQTTLGLAVKLHHIYGSSELIKLLHNHGFIVSYDEVLRFRKSAAKFVGDNSSLLHQAMGMTRKVGPVFGWFDNFDLQVSTPNGCRDTHVMAHQFQMNPTNVVESENSEVGIMNLVIPRLCKTVAQSVTPTQPIKLHHYTGPKKVDPPVISITSGIPYRDLCAMEQSLKSAQHKDTKWLNTLSMEWSGFNNQLAREEGSSSLKPGTVHLIGHLIDAPPSHPDTVLTSLIYMKESLAEQGMTYTNISIDMQLYMIAQQIKWSQPERFKDVILRPGAMHIIMSFLGCIGTLMKGSGLDVLVGAAFGHITGIMNGKAWVMSMRAFRMVTVALLQHLLDDGENVFEELSAYLEEARHQPTGKHWVNLVKPTLLVHQFLRAEREGDWLFQQLCLRRMLPYFFRAGHIHYARYISWHLLEMQNLPDDVKAYLIVGAHVCRHSEGSWNSVSGDEFGEQTAIKTGKGSVKGMILSPELVTEWIDSFPISTYLSDAMENLYMDQGSSSASQGSKKKKVERGKHLMLLIERKLLMSFQSTPIH